MPSDAGIIRDGGLVTLTSKGTVYVAADFHARFTDYQRWLKSTQILEKLKNGEDVYGVLLGDVADKKGTDPEADEKNGDSRIVDAFREAQSKLGKMGNRLILLQGNHEYEVIKLYQLLKEAAGLNRQNQKAIVEKLFATENGATFRQFNFVERITDEQHAFLKELPVAVVFGNGVMATHAGPSISARSLDDIARLNPEVVNELLWSRPAAGRATGYTEKDLADFLKRMKARVLLCGHTPLPLLPDELIRDGVAVYGGRQIILGTSYGAMPRKKSYLKINLAKAYDNADDIQPGREIRPLMEPHSMHRPARSPSAAVPA